MKNKKTKQKKLDLQAYMKDWTAILRKHNIDAVYGGPIGVDLYDADGNIHTVNQVFPNLSGYTHHTAKIVHINKAKK